MTVVITAIGLRTSFCTAFLYFAFMALKDALNDVCIRSSIDIFFSWPSLSCGFRKMAQRAGESVKALAAEMTMEIAIVRPNCL